MYLNKLLRANYIDFELFHAESHDCGSYAHVATVHCISILAINFELQHIKPMCVCVTHSLCIYEKSKQQIALNKMRNVTRINLREVNDDRKKIYFDDLYVDFHRRRRRLNQNQQA